MKKQTYMKPAMHVVLLQHQNLLAASVNHIDSGDTGITYGGGSSGEARVKQNDYSVWNDDWNK